MNPAERWWLENTPTGRRTLAKILPSSAIPPHTRRLICEEQGHVLAGDGSCVRCGERNPK